MTSLAISQNTVITNWENCGASKEQAELLANQGQLLKAMREAIHQEPANDQSSLISAKVVPLSAEIGLKKAKKTVSCNNVLLVASYFPVFGPIISNTCKILEAKKVKSTADTDKITQLKAKINQFRISSIVSTLLTVALAVSALVVGGILLGGIAFFATIGAAAAATALALTLVTIDGVNLHRSKHPKPILEIDPTKQKSPRKIDTEIKAEKVK